MLCTVKIEGRDAYPAMVEGSGDVYQVPEFVLAKPRWVPDEAVTSCPLCKNKFGQLRRKHHCRQCGRVLCNKCCNEKIPLPQLGLDEPERVCESCRPVTQLVTKSRSQLPIFQTEAARGLTDMCSSNAELIKVIERGGAHTLVALCRKGDQNEALIPPIIRGLQVLSTHQPLHRLLGEIGAIRAICDVLGKSDTLQEHVLLDGISALMIFCKSPELKTTALRDGALPVVLKLCCNPCDAVALLAVSTLSLVVEHPDTHKAVIDNDKKALTRILALTASPDEQMQEVSLKVLTHLSLGTDWNKHRIVQEDFSSGRSLLTAIQSKPKNVQVLCNAACLIANLATSPEDQSALQEQLECLAILLRSDITSSDLMVHIIRGIANFSRFKQNATKLISSLPVIVFKCLKSPNAAINNHGFRAVLNLLSHLPKQTTEELLRDGAGVVLEQIAQIPGLLDVINTSLLTQTSDKARPLN